MLTVDASTTYYLPLIASLSPWDGNYAFIGGSAVLYEQKSLQIDRAVGKAKASVPCSFSVPDESGTYTFTDGQPVTITDAADGTTFTGYIDNDTIELINPAGARRHKIVCKAADYLAQKRDVKASIYCNPIRMIKWLSDTYLASSGVTYDATSIPDPVNYFGASLKFGASSKFTSDPKISISYIGQMVSYGLDDLTDQTNRYWYIDTSKKLWAIPTNTIAAPFTLQASDIMFDQHPTLQKSADKYKNTFTVQNSLGLMPKVDPFKGDGTRQSFTLTLPCNSKPSIAVNGVIVSGSSIGILGVDTNKQWWWNTHSNIITQDATLSPLNPGDSLQVTYTGEYTQTVTVSNASAIAARATLESTDGIVESFSKISTPMTQADATTYANSQLATYCASSTTFNFKTKKPGLGEGMWLPMNVPQFGLTSPMLITNYSIEDAGITDTGEGYTYNITAVSGPLAMMWVNTFGG